MLTTVRLLVPLALLALAGCSSTPAPTAAAGGATPSGVDAWRQYEVGTVIELRSHTVARPPMMPFEASASIRHQVLALDDDVVTLLTRFQQVDPLRDPEEQENRIPRGSPPELDLGGTFVRSETITVPAGTFDCSLWRAEAIEHGLKWTREVWTTPDVPLPVRFVQNGPSSTVVELARIERPVAR